MLKVVHQATAPSAGAQVLWQVPRAVAVLRKAGQACAQQILSAEPNQAFHLRVQEPQILAFQASPSQKQHFHAHSCAETVRSFETQYLQAVCEEEAGQSLVRIEIFPLRLRLQNQRSSLKALFFHTLTALKE